MTGPAPLVGDDVMIYDGGSFLAAGPVSWISANKWSPGWRVEVYCDDGGYTTFTVESWSADPWPLRSWQGTTL